MMARQGLTTVLMTARYKRNMPGDVCSFPDAEAAVLIARGGATRLGEDGRPDPRAVRMEPGPSVITTHNPTGTTASGRPLRGAVLDPRGGGYYDVVRADGELVAGSVRREEAEAMVAQLNAASGGGAPQGVRPEATAPGMETRQERGPAGAPERAAMPGRSTEEQTGGRTVDVAGAPAGYPGDRYPLRGMAERDMPFSRRVRAQRAEEGATAGLEEQGQDRRRPQDSQEQQQRGPQSPQPGEKSDPTVEHQEAEEQDDGEKDPSRRSARRQHK